MVHWWQDPATETHLATLYVDMLFLMLGVYGWEYFQSCDVEYAVIRGCLPFRWPLIPYLLGRIFLLIGLILSVVEMSPFTDGFPCQYGTTAITIAMGIAIGTSSANLFIRTWVMWKDCRLIQILLSLFTIGHWTILAFDAGNIRAYERNGICTVHLVHPDMSAVVFLYTEVYDFVVLILCIVKLSKQPSKSPLGERLLSQGLLYFVVATVSSILPMVFVVLGSDAMVSLISTFTITASVIVSCRAVRSLLCLDVPSSGRPNENSRNAVLTTQLTAASIASTEAC